MPRLAVIQIRCAVGDVQTNLRKAADGIAEASRKGAQIVCLPECFTTGLVYGQMEALAEPVPGPSSEALCQAAAEGGLWVVAGMVEREGEAIYNTALVITPQGEVACRYHKCFLYMQEAEIFTRGTKACVVDMGIAKAGVTICYDYAFPEYVRTLVLSGAQLLTHSTAWVDTEVCRRWRYPAVEAFRAQGRVRALENGIYLMSANHCGPYDPDGALQGIGHSAIIAPWGEVLAELTTEEGVAVADADFSLIPRWAEEAAPYLRDYREAVERGQVVPPRLLS